MENGDVVWVGFGENEVVERETKEEYGEDVRHVVGYDDEEGGECILLKEGYD